MMRSGLFTIDSEAATIGGVLVNEQGTSCSSSWKKITKAITARTLILRRYRIDYVLPVYVPRPGQNDLPSLNYVNIQIGNIIGNDYIIDDDPSARLLCLGLTRDVPVVFGSGGGAINGYSTSVECCLPFTMTGDLDVNFELRITGNDQSALLPDLTLRYVFLQFEMA